MWMTRISIKNPVFAIMIMFAIVVLGALGYQRMRVEQYPDVEWPFILVRTVYAGASPEAVELKVSKPLEGALNSLSGVESIVSRSYLGFSDIAVRFKLNTDMAQAVRNLENQVNIVKGDFETGISTPVVTVTSPDQQPILSLELNAPSSMPLTELTDVAELQVKKALLDIDGVGEAIVLGGVKRQLKIDLKPDQMQAYGVSVAEIISVVNQNNKSTPTGTITSGSSESILQIDSTIHDLDGFRNLVVSKRSGSVVRLGQLSDITLGGETPKDMSFTDGKQSMSLVLTKARGANTVDVIDQISKTLEQLYATLPAGVKLTILQDSTKSINSSLAEVKSTIYEGAALTIFIIFLFLHSWRSTVITALTLPISIIGSFGIMYLLGYTINTMTLGALSLSIGLLIDDAIVVRENIVRHVQMGKDHYSASIEGTDEIGLAVLATTLCMIAVFLPIGQMDGLLGQFFHSFGNTVVIVVLLSLLVAFSLDPMLSSIWPDPDIQKPLHQHFGGRLLMWFDRQIEKFSMMYQYVLKWSLKHRKTTLAIASLTFLGSLPVLNFLGSEFAPTGDYSEMNIRFHTPIDSTLQQTSDKTIQVQQALKAKFPEIDFTFGLVGSIPGNSNVVDMFVKLQDRKSRKLGLEELKQPIRAELNKIAGVRVSKVIGQTGGPNGAFKQLEYFVQGPDLNKLKIYSDDLLKKIAAIKGVADLESSAQSGRPAIHFNINQQKAADMGVDINDLSKTMSVYVSGVEAGTWKDKNGNEVGINIQLPESKRQSVERLTNLQYLTGVSPLGQIQMVRVGDLVDVSKDQSAPMILRENLQRQVRIDANTYMRKSGEVSNEIEKILENYTFEPGYKYVIGGDSKIMKESLKYASFALVIGLVFIYIVLASQFNSYLHPLAIMSALPLTVIGVLLALLMFNSTVNMFSVVGFVLLMGLVTKNAILLIDFTNQARASGMRRGEAIIEASKIRLRPILMTTLAMIFGMLPMAIGLGEGSEMRAPMGQAVIGGTFTSTLLTLIVVPVFYTYLDDLNYWYKKIIDGKAKAQGDHY